MFVHAPCLSMFTMHLGAWGRSAGGAVRVHVHDAGNPPAMLLPPLLREAAARQFVYDGICHLYNPWRGPGTLGDDNAMQCEKDGNVA
jgi:hypothetical protein